MSTRKKYVLIAEDEAFLAEMMGKVLTANGVSVAIAHNGKDAVQAMKKRVPDLLFLDLLMPVLDGYGVLRAMREQGIDCPVIVVSNLTDTMTRNTCKEMRVKEYLVKSDMDAKLLWPAVKKYLK